MEHIVQFGIGIDDEAIKNAICKNAEKTITENIQKKIEQTIFVKDYYGRATKNRFNGVAEDLLMEWMDQHKDEIIQQAAKLITDRIARTKAVKNAMNDVMEAAKSEKE